MSIHIETYEKDFLFALVKEGLRLATIEKRKLNKNDIQKIINQDFFESFKNNANSQSENLSAIISENLNEKIGAFVSYFVQKSQSSQNKKPEKMLRGCIGMMVGQLPLWATIVDMTYKAAREDTRFPPIQEEELSSIIYDITLLGPLSVCQEPTKIELGKHGIMLQAKGKHAVFLPHVPIEQGWTLEQTFEQLCYKAGLPKEAWKEKGTTFYWYEGLLLHP